jgi:hypothetical protein
MLANPSLPLYILTPPPTKIAFSPIVNLVNILRQWHSSVITNSLWIHHELLITPSLGLIVGIRGFVSEGRQADKNGEAQ